MLDQLHVYCYSTFLFVDIIYQQQNHIKVLLCLKNVNSPIKDFLQTTTQGILLTTKHNEYIYNVIGNNLR